MLYVLYVICYINKYENKYVKDKIYCKVRDHCHYTEQHRGATDSICSLKYSVSKNVPIAFHNGSNYDLADELADEFEK